MVCGRTQVRSYSIRHGRSRKVMKGKITMKLKKMICVLAAAAVAASFAACGSGESSSEDGADTTAAAAAEPAQGEAQAALSAADIADKLHSEITYVDSLNELSPEMIEKIYGISADKYTSGKVYVGGVSTAEEIACFDAVDEAAAAAIKTACDERIAAQIKSVESYNPDELPKLQNPVLVTRGNSVLMCLSNDNDKAKEIIG